MRQPIQYPYIEILDLIVKNHMRDNPDFFFIQIGANDGITTDPVSYLIKRYHWRGVLVEPQPMAFKKLVENYQAEKQLSFENSIIADKDGTATFYSVPEDTPGVPFWFYQTGSLDRQRLIKTLKYGKNTSESANLPEDIETLIQTKTLPALSINTLLSKYDVQKLDLLVMDTMGYDLAILNKFPFDRLKPSIIHFEHSLLSLEDQQECFEYLAKHGYSLIQVSVDTIAYLHGETRPGLYYL